MDLNKRLLEAGLTLPPAPPAGGIYKPVLVIDNMLYVSGQGPVRQDGSLITGKVGVELDVREGQDAARQVGLTMLSTIRTYYDLSAIRRLVKTFGMVNCTPDFHQQPQVINGFSALMADLLGEENGTGVRSAVGMTLPGNIAVEVEAIFQLR